MTVRLTRAQVREVDRRSIEHYHVPGIVLMENAARAVTDVAWEMLGHAPGSVRIICGGGNNGGDGLAVARHLHNRGCDVRIVLAIDPQAYRGDAEINWTIVKAMRLPIDTAPESSRLDDAELIIDALFGTGLILPPRDARLIDRMNAQSAPVLSIDLPSGMDCDTGQPLGACVRATRTVTFVAEKAGFANPASRAWTGDITVGDIGCPREIVEQVLQDMPA